MRRCEGAPSRREEWEAPLCGEAGAPFSSGIVTERGGVGGLGLAARELFFFIGADIFLRKVPYWSVLVEKRLSAPNRAILARESTAGGDCIET